MKKQTKKVTKLPKNFGKMQEPVDTIGDLLIEFTDGLGFNKADKKQMKAFKNMCFALEKEINKMVDQGYLAGLKKAQQLVDFGIDGFKTANKIK